MGVKKYQIVPNAKCIIMALSAPTRPNFDYPHASCKKQILSITVHRSRDPLKLTLVVDTVHEKKYTSYMCFTHAQRLSILCLYPVYNSVDPISHGSLTPVVLTRRKSPLDTSHDLANI